MPLVIPDDSLIKLEDLTLDYYLEAFPLVGAKIDRIDMTGQETYKIKPYTESLGFGITAIDIDIKPNLQPIIIINFKDLYGNLVFNKNNDYKYNVLFEMPYPKFKLYVKGYLGKQVSFILQVKSIKTTFQPSDGSFDIKGEFIPNIFGFFNDIPYQYLFAVPEIKNQLKDNIQGVDNNSIIQIADVGTQILTSIRQVEDKYSILKNRLNLFSVDPIQISLNYNDKNNNMSFEKIDGDDDLRSGGFSAITFNLDLRTLTIPKDDVSLSLIGSAILASINSPKKIIYKDNTSINDIKNFVQSEEGEKQISRNKNLIAANIDIIQKVTTAKGTLSVSDVKIDSQTIFNVMTKLAGDAGYVLGYILESGLNGYNLDSSRDQNTDLVGYFYPLVEKSFPNSSAFGEQTPYDKAAFEIGRVNLFVNALMEGINKAKEVIQRREEENQPPQDVPETEPTIDYIKRKITNLEVLKKNPYSDNIDSFIVNLIQRCGLMSCGYSSSSNSTPETGGAMSKIAEKSLWESEFVNLENIVVELRGTKAAQLKKFCETVVNNFFANGKTKSGVSLDTTQVDGKTLRQYFASYFNKFPKSNEKEQFKNSKSETLTSIYTYNNDILYYNAAELKTAISLYTDTNNLLGNKPQIFTYVPNKNFPIEVLDPKTRNDDVENFKQQVIGKTESDPTMPQAPDARTSNIYYAWYFFSANTNSGNIIQEPDKDSKSVFIDYEKLFNKTKYKPNELIVQYIKNVPPSSKGIKKSNINDGVVRLIDEIDFENPKNWVVNLEDELCRSYLYFLCNQMLLKGKLNLSDAEKDKSKIITSGGGTIPPVQQTVPELTAEEKQRIKEETFRSVYVQFHHICHAWISLSNVDNPDSDTLPSGTNIELRNKLENLYKSTNKNANFHLDFTFPVISSSEKEFDVKGAIINTDFLLENNSETSTLNMMQNICSKNNFILQPIPGGVTDDLEDLFYPYPTIDYSVGRNALYIAWSPTPESRYSNNKNEPIYPEKGFSNMPALLNSLKYIPLFQFGSPKNIILKSVKAGTDDNKVTSDSLAATSDIVNNENSNKKKGFDCSMISVLQGRSYSINLEMLGNSQIYPTMHLVVDGLPIFTGLYWINEVQHKITPNQMETTVGAIKMKYNGKDKFMAIPPITKRTLESLLSGSGPNGSSFPRTTENLCNGGRLNEEFCKQVKDKKINKPSDIGEIVKQYTNNRYTDFVTWFNTEIFNKCPLAKTQINKANFDKVWNEKFTSILWNNYGTQGINFIEFVTIHSIIYNEVGGDYKSLREQMNDVTAKDHPGVAYAFDTIGDKLSYNSSPNVLASDLFLNTNYIEAHKSKKFGDDPSIRTIKNWSENKPGVFPISSFPNPQDAVSTSPTFINEADFYKFSGRGLIKTSWRTSYKLLVDFVLKYSGTDQKILNYKNVWSQTPYFGNSDNVLSLSSNSDWDDLFDNTEEIQLAAFDIFWKNGSKIKDSQYVDLNQSKDIIIKSINNVAKSITDKSDYVNTHQSRVFIILDQLYPAGAFRDQSISVNFDFSGDIGEVLGKFFDIILAGESKTFDDHNWYVNGKNLRGYIKGRSTERYSLLQRDLSQYTIAEVQDFQNHIRDSVGQLWATGRYQIIPNTLDGLIASSKISTSELYNENNQKILGLQLLKDKKTIWQYVTGKVPDTQEKLQLACLGTAQIWSSVGVPYPVQGKNQFVQTDQSYYSGGGDRASVKSSTVMGALLALRKSFVELGIK